jgi:hypothetical protein
VYLINHVSSCHTAFGAFQAGGNWVSVMTWEMLDTRGRRKNPEEGPEDPWNREHSSSVTWDTRGPRLYSGDLPNYLRLHGASILSEQRD